MVQKPEFVHSFFGVLFLDLASGRTLYALNPDKFFVPGSTTKLTATGAALALLGPDYRFHTRVYRTGEVAPDGTLEGDLVLVASGDPNLSARVRDDDTLAFENEDHSYGGTAVPGDPLLVLRKLAASVAAQGTRRVSGRVLVDATLFPQGEREGGTSMVLSPIVVNDNVVDVQVSPGPAPGAPATLRVSPDTAYVRFVNQIVTRAADARGADPAVGSDTTAADGSHQVTLTGGVGVGANPSLLAYGAPEPDRFAALLFSDALRDQGVRALPGPRDQPADFKALSALYTPDRQVAEHVSPPLAQAVKVILKVSQNLHASQMPYILGLGAAAPREAGFDRMRELFTSARLDLRGAAQGDGAGATAHFTPRFMVSYLAWAARQPFAKALFDALPVLGRDGTLHNIQVDAPAAGHVHAKTGTYGEDDPLNRAQFVNGKGLAGYVDTRDGRRLAFCAYLNHVPVAKTPDAIREVAGQALGAIAAAAYDAR